MTYQRSTSLATAIVSIGLVGFLWAPAEAQSPLKTVTGKVSKVEGEFQMSKDLHGDDTLDIVDRSYIITDQSGKEVRLELDDHTKIRERVNPGDKIEAKISSEGDTLSITRIEP
jgi:hypothetical protein